MKKANLRIINLFTSPHKKYKQFCYILAIHGSVPYAAGQRKPVKTNTRSQCMHCIAHNLACQTTHKQKKIKPTKLAIKLYCFGQLIQKQSIINSRNNSDHAKSIQYLTQWRYFEDQWFFYSCKSTNHMVKLAFMFLLTLKYENLTLLHCSIALCRMDYPKYYTSICTCPTCRHNLHI